MQEEAVGDVHASVEQFRDHLETTIRALQDSTTELIQSFKSVSCVARLLPQLAELIVQLCS